tara:strand:+ start:143 stop:385 length:243 start_codon:yes stop_codon:yes gene_type:complete
LEVLVVEAFLRRDVGVIGYCCLHQQCEAAEAHATGAAGAELWWAAFSVATAYVCSSGSPKATNIRALALQIIMRIKSLLN